MLPRKHYLMKGLDEKVKGQPGGYGGGEVKEDVPDVEANLVSSQLDYPYEEGIDDEDKLHAPALDIDLPIECYESSTPGHYHLFIDRPMTWRQYKQLLHALAKAGIIEDGYYKASLKRGATFLRKKGVKKAQADPLPEVQMTWQ